MDGGIKNLAETMRGASKLYIPVYQRNYDWKVENCQRLLQDFERILDENLNKHFFGSLVVKPGNKHMETIVIDGQQRLTTLSVMLLALAHYLDDKDINTAQLNSDLIINTYLIDQWGPQGDNFRLKPNPKDFASYKKLFGDPKMFDRNSNITRNYLYFRDYYEEKMVNPQNLIHAFQRLEVMIVNLNSPDDDPQQIFESLNSTGLALNDADRIRNFLLMNETQEAQEFYYLNYWEKLEELTLYDLEEFFRHYLTVKESKTPTKSKVYQVFQLYFDSEWKDDKLAFFRELLDYAFAYNQILEAKTQSKKINGYLYRFNRLDVTVMYPFLLSVLEDFNAERICESDILDIFKVLETYIVRRAIVNLPTNALNKVFATLYRDMIKYLDYAESYVDSLIFVLLKKSGSGELPKDELFIQQLETMNMYDRNSRLRTYFYERIENEDHIETINIYEGIDNGNFSIEHIMPQKLTIVWQQGLGDNYQEIHDKYLNNIGNLTLTGYNSKYSNKSFKEKKAMDRGFDDSHFAILNKIPKECEEWGAEEILRRRDQLIDLSLEIWAFPETSIDLTDLLEGELAPMDSNLAYTGDKIKGYKFRNSEYTSVRYWVEMFKNIFSELALEYPEYFTRKAQTNSDYGLNWALSSVKKTGKETELLPNVFLTTSISNESKMNLIRDLFDELEIQYDELMLDIVNSDE